jgi:hypothetical protein
MRQLTSEKFRDKTIRESMFAQRHSQMPSETEHIALLNASAKPTSAAEGSGFNPYEEGLPYRDAPTAPNLPVPQTYAEEGYGGGTWRLSNIRAEEKDRVAAHGGPLSDDGSYRTRPDVDDTMRAVPPSLEAPHPAMPHVGSDAFSPPGSQLPAKLAPPPASGVTRAPPVNKDDDDEDFL